MILDDRYFPDFDSWADRLSLQLAPYGTVPNIHSVLDWKRWAQAVIQFPSVSGQGPPSPAQYADWRSWVKDFNLCVNLNAL